MKIFFIKASVIIVIITALIWAAPKFFSRLSYEIYEYENFYKDKEYIEINAKEAESISDDFVKSNTAVIVRSVGERTEDVCLELLGDIFGKENIIFIKNITPLKSAAEICCEIALKKNKKWTLIVDADTLVIKQRLLNFLKYAELLSQKHDDVYCVNGLMISKFRVNPYTTGINLFYTNHLPKALNYIRESHFFKTEEFVKAKMFRENLQTYEILYVIGLADFFQFYRDIIRKSLIFSYKWKGINREKIFWEKNSFFDNDFKYALEGCNLKESAGAALYNGYDSVDSRMLNDYIDKLTAGNKIKIKKQKLLKLKEALNAVNYFKFHDTDTVKIDKSVIQSIYEDGKTIYF